MIVLIACEESQAVCKAFRKQGHIAFSCDIDDCSGGHPFIKTTCLWLKGVKPLRPTKILTKPDNGWVNQSFTASGRYGGFNGLFNDPKVRSKTFEGIAEAMADQWGAQ